MEKVLDTLEKVLGRLGNLEAQLLRIEGKVDGGEINAPEPVSKGALVSKY